MQSVAVTRDPGAIAFRQGLTFALIFVGLQGIIESSTNFLPLDAFGLLISMLNFILSLVLFLLAGICAARQTGRVSTGTMAGTFAGTIGGMISLGIDLLIASFRIDSLRQSIQEAADALNQGFHYTNTMAFASIVFIAVFGLLLAVGLGTGFGALGGLIGKRQAKLPDIVSFQQSGD